MRTDEGHTSILLATGSTVKMGSMLQTFEGFQIAAEVNSASQMYDVLRKKKVDVIITSLHLEVTVNLALTLQEALQIQPQVRIVILLGQEKEQHRPFYESLVTMGIYDLVFGTKINAKTLYGALIQAKRMEDVQHYVTTTIEERDSIQVVMEEKGTGEQVERVPKIIGLCSVKPGTGKSFASTNIATAIAKFGAKKNGQTPKVALLEADLQNLSVGTLLGLNLQKKKGKGLVPALEHLRKLANLDEEFHVPTHEMYRITKDEVMRTLVVYEAAPNLSVLAGTIDFESINEVTAKQYQLLLSMLEDEFDVILVDMNSNFHHVTTIPLFVEADLIYFVLNLDFNNFSNNVRYRETLEKYQISPKVRYMLNEDFTQSGKGIDGEEELMCTPAYVESQGFRLEARIPEVSKVVFSNCAMEGRPLVLRQYDKQVEVARRALLQIANQIWPIPEVEEFVATATLKRKWWKFSLLNKKKGAD